MLSQLSYLFSKHQLDGFLITEPLTVRYLSGFTGTNGLLICTRRRNFFVTDSRYTEQAKKQVTGFTILTIDRSLSEQLQKIIKKVHIKRLGFQAAHVTVAALARYKKIFPGVRLMAVAGDPGELRAIKNKHELALLTNALQINKIAFAKTINFIKPGVTELSVARRLEQQLLAAGAERIGFDTIVASGARGALPHGVASGKKIKKGELITIDFGGVYQGYHADETVTVCVGRPTLKQQKIWRIVYGAQQAAVALAVPGVSCEALDKAARDHIALHGFGQYFGHALGHGVGLDIHERPVLSAGSKDTLGPGTVFTIEPGIYIPDWGGVRIEDVYATTQKTIKQLSLIPKKLISL